MLHQAYCFSLSIILSGIFQSWFRHAFVSHLFEIRIWACIAFEAESCTKVAFALRIWIPQMFFASLVQNLIKFYHNRFKFYIFLYRYHKIYWHCTRFTDIAEWQKWKLDCFNKSYSPQNFTWTYHTSVSCSDWKPKS